METIRDLEIKLDALAYQGFKKGDKCFDHYLKLWIELQIRHQKTIGSAFDVDEEIVFDALSDEEFNY